MKKQELIKMIEALPDDADIFIMISDDIMGYYSFVEPYIYEDEAYKGTNKKGQICYESTVSNWTPNDYQEVKIWRIG